MRPTATIRASEVVGDRRKIGARSFAIQRRDEIAGLLGRIVDGDHAVDAGLARASRQRSPIPIASIGLA